MSTTFDTIHGGIGRADLLLGRFMANIISLVKGQRVSPQEIDSVSYFVDKILLSSSLLNDLYSFPKEFEEHSSAGNMDTIGNAMALLMSGYGYNEDEAANILKREISELEERALEEFHAWQNSNLTKSPSLVRYVFTVMTAAGGFNYWMSHSERYFRTDFTTTAEDRARLVRNPDSCLGRLQGYPAPLALNGHSTSTLDLDAVSESHVSRSDSSLTSMTTAGSQVSVDGLGCSGMEIGITDKFQKADAENLCMDPYNYISSLPGKGTVAKLADTLQTWFNVPAESTEIIKTCSTILFHSSLMLDDIQDDSSKRRGMPAAHVMYGVCQTVNCVSYTGAKAFFLCEELKNANVCRKALYDELDNLFSGQALELHWKFHRKCPSMNDYINMIDNKTAAFFRLVLRLMAAEASVPMSPGKENTLLHFITLLGRYYQIRDDYQNLVSDEYAAKKGFCDDLSEGKFSLILIHTLNNSPTADRIRGLMFGGHRAGMSQEIRSYILSEMEAAGSLEYTKRIITELYETLWRMLDELEATLGPNTLLRALVQFLKI
ncbi:isoprenoid synthase domain-containing protein [Aspergillus transmontanensis]|uniref:Isoprenoid synthase domain-containing protein n=1 Tax=Aspergillus transmontanensis TaxID=1034304 RepID=A0A5N6W0J4_9EURO|nr:isoprenoid synthase domain-containing protein [Aspergillus transmontanensis]